MSQAVVGVPGSISSTSVASTSTASTRTASARVAFLDHIRYLMVVLVVITHSVAAYSTVTPHWPHHDTIFLAADVIRELIDVFAMPVLFFVAGYFALRSLEKKGTRAFLKDKVLRLLVPWALAVLVFMPLVLYSKGDPAVRPFSSYWPSYLGGFGTQLSILLPESNQSVYWFVSLLFAVFVLFAVAHAATRRWHTRHPLSSVEASSSSSLLMPLVIFGVLTSLAYFVSLLLAPDTAWLVLGPFLQFEPTRLVLFIGYFALGVYAQSHGWFAGGKSLGHLAVWGPLTALLAVAYLVVGQPLFADPTGTTQMPVGLLLTFAFVRSFLLLSVLVTLASAGTRYWARSSGLDRQLSDTSYNVYLTHFWFVVVLQEELLAWTGGSSEAKFAIVFLAALGLSYAISRWIIGRYPRAFAAVLLALFVLGLVGL